MSTKSSVTDLVLFISMLEHNGACRDAVSWLKDRPIDSTPEQAWNECERGEWLLWLAGCVAVDRKLLVLAACACAEPALKFVKAGEDRPRKAIEVARAWCEGKATIEEVRTARNAAAFAAAAAAYAPAAPAYAAPTPPPTPTPPPPTPPPPPPTPPPPVRRFKPIRPFSFDP